MQGITRTQVIESVRYQDEIRKLDAQKVQAPRDEPLFGTYLIDLDAVQRLTSEELDQILPILERLTLA